MTIFDILALASLPGSVVCGLYVRHRLNATDAKVAALAAVKARPALAILPPLPPAPPLPDGLVELFVRDALTAQLAYEEGHAPRQAERIGHARGLKVKHGDHGAYDRDQRVASVLIRTKTTLREAGHEPPANLAQLVAEAVK